MKKLGLLFLLGLLSGWAHGTTWYVTTTGNNSNPCTQASPCATPDHAEGIASPGDTVQVAAGTYDYGAGNLNITKSGTAGNYITVTCVTKWACSIRSATTGNTTIAAIQANYVIFDGFDVTRSGSNANNIGIWIDGNFLKVTRNRIHDIIIDCSSSGGGGISSTPTIHDDTFDSNLIYAIGWADGGSPICDNSVDQFDGIITETAGVNMVYSNNIIYHVSGGWGLGLGGHNGEVQTPMTIVNNIIFENGDGGIILTNTGDGSLVYNNIIVNNGGQSSNGGGGQTNGCGINTVFPGTGTDTSVQEKNNDVYGNAGGSFCVFAGPIQSGNISVNPALGTTFVNWQANGYFAGGDYHQKAGSPTLNAGLFTTGTNHDYEGKSRPGTGAFDIGAYQAGGTTWYVDPVNGGPRISAGNPGVASCTGKGTTAFNGSGGAGQACPFRVARYLWNDPYIYQDAGWVISGGDTVETRNADVTHPTEMSGSTGNYGDGGWGIGPNSSPPPTPSGIAGQHTVFRGQNYAACSTTNAQGITVMDPAKAAYLWAGGGTGQLLDMSTSQYVDVSCMQFRSHSSCNGINLSCSGTEWAGRGIWTGSTAANSNITLTNMQITGFQSRGIIGNLGGPWTLTNVEISFNGSAGWDLDPGTGSTRDSANTTIDMENNIVAWNGCSRQYPDVNAIPVQANSCTDDAHGGYGDGIGTPPDFGILSWTVNHSYLSYNTQDGPDLGHLLSGTVIYTNNLLEGNMGGNLKVGNATVLKEYNNFTKGNCTRMAQPITGAVAGFNTNLSDFCRAGGDQNTFNYDPNLGHTLTADIEFNTYVGTGATILDAQCFNGPCVAGSGYTFIFSNNAVYGVANGIASPSPYPYNANQQPGMWNNLFPTTEAKNLFYNLKSCPATGSDISPTCVLSPAFVNQPVPTITAESQLDNFNFYPNTGSALIHAATYNASIPLDYYGVTRPNPPTVGAAEPTGGTPTVATPTCTPVAGTYATTQTVSCTTATPSAIICGTTDGSTPTATTPGTCSHGTAGPFTVATSATVKAIGTLAAYTNSSVASYAYTITPAPTLVAIAVAPSPGAVTVAGTLAMTCTATYSDTSTGACVSPVWADTNAHSTISGSGVVTGGSAGSDTISAAIGAISGTSTITVTATPPGEVVIGGTGGVSGTVVLQ